jgi:hypothetical protein
MAGVPSAAYAGDRALVEAMQVFGAAWADGPLLRAGAHVARGAQLPV